MDKLPKRFYESVDLNENSGQFQILLDQRTAKARSGAHLATGYHSLAEAIAEEWRSQETHIDFTTMPLTRYQMTIVEMDDGQRGQWRQEIAAFSANDLLCYRAEGPEELCELQKRHWDQFLGYVSLHCGLRFEVTSGVVSIEQPADTLAKVIDLVESFNDETLLATRRITELTGSAILALCAQAGINDPEKIVEAAQIDELFQAKQWGYDKEADERRNMIRQDILDALLFLKLTR